MCRQNLTRHALSICARPNDVDHVSTWWTNSQRQLFPRNRDKAILVRSIPVWKGAAFNMNYDTAICFAYRIRSEVGYGTVGRLFIFFGCALPKGIARVFSTISLHYGDDVSPTHIEEGDPLRPRPVALDLGAVTPFLLPRNQRPSTDKPILYRLFWPRASSVI
jgi:hypothetical protein